MIIFDNKPVALQFPLASMAISEERQIKLPSLLKPEKLGKRHAYKWVYIGLLAEYPQITLPAVKRAFRSYSKDELLEAVYASMAVDMDRKDSLKRLSFFMEEVN